MTKQNQSGKPAARWAKVLVLCVIIVGGAFVAGAEVVDRSASGFTTKNTATIAAPLADKVLAEQLQRLKACVEKR